MYFNKIERVRDIDKYVKNIELFFSFEFILSYLLKLFLDSLF